MSEAAPGAGVVGYSLLRLACVLEENIPEALKRLHRWVCWKYEFVDGRWTKLPWRANGRGHASSTDPKTWSDFETALAAYRKGGFVLAREERIVGIDLDHCIDENKVIAPWALTIIKGSIEG